MKLKIIQYGKKIDIYQLKRFIISGGSATVCHLGTMAILIWFSVNASLSTSAGVITGAILNYILQYHYTFGSNAKHKHSVIKYIITISISFTSNLILFILFHNFLQINVIISQLFTSAIVALQNYLIYKKFVFLKEEAIYEL